MSNSLAIATVTEALRQVLDDAAADSGVAGAVATAIRPAAEKNIAAPVNPTLAGVNLFLYQVIPNGPLSNTDIPTRRSDGSLRVPTRSAYDLHYLLTFFGNESELEPQRVMGNVLRVMHSLPVVTRRQVQNAKLSLAFLATSDLDTEIELVKVEILPLNLEDLAKLWSVFFQIPYNLSVAIQASVVFIDGKEVPSPALPVQIRNVYVRLFQQPVIEQVLSQKTPLSEALPDQPIEIGDTILLVGKMLQGDVTRIRIGEQVIDPTEVTDTRVKFILDMPPFPADRLRAGVQGVQIVQFLRMGTPATDHTGIESNIESFVIRPKITPAATPVSTKVVDGITFCTNDITLDFIPTVGLCQRVMLLLNEFNPPAGRPARAYRFNVPFTAPNPSDTYIKKIKTRITDVVEGEYLLRVQVDGAESTLGAKPDPDNPMFIKPKVTIQ